MDPRSAVEVIEPTRMLGEPRSGPGNEFSAPTAVAAESRISNALAAREKARTEAGFVVARSRPRQLPEFRRKLLARCDEFTFAEGALYKLKRGDKDIIGPSIRMAEECARLYGNLDVSTMILDDGPESRTIEVRVVDLEVNNTFSGCVVVPKTVERKFLKDGQKPISSRVNSYGEQVHLVEATDADVAIAQAAAVAKLKRDRILDQIPNDVLGEAETAVKLRLRKGDGDTPTNQRKKLLDAFASEGVTSLEIEQYCGFEQGALNDLTRLTDADLFQLRIVFAAIKYDDVTFADLLKKDKDAEAKVAERRGSDEEQRAPLVQTLNSLKLSKPAAYGDACKRAGVDGAATAWMRTAPIKQLAWIVAEIAPPAAPKPAAPAAPAPAAAAPSGADMPFKASGPPVDAPAAEAKPSESFRDVGARAAKKAGDA